MTGNNSVPVLEHRDATTEGDQTLSAIQATGIDVEAARRLTERIRRVALNVAEQVEDLRALVAEAKETEAHVALGYPSWTAYLADLFGDEPLRLARDVRRELVAELHDQGMSTRAIAPIVGVTQQQVSKDLQVTTEASPAIPSWDLPAWAEPASEGAPVITPKPIVKGLDGKNYPTSDRAPRRPPTPATPTKRDRSQAAVEERWEQIKKMASDGRTSAEVARTFDMNESGLRRRARERGIQFHADRLSNRIRIKSDEVLEQLVLGLEVTESSLGLIRLEDISPEQARDALERLAAPLRALNRLRASLKEIA